MLSEAYIQTITEIQDSKADDTVKVKKLRALADQRGTPRSKNEAMSRIKAEAMARNMLPPDRYRELEFPELTRQIQQEENEKDRKGRETISIPEEVIDNIQEFKTSNIPEEKFIYELFNTGLRFKDLLSRELTTVDGVLHTKGLSKKRGEEADKLYPVHSIKPVSRAEIEAIRTSLAGRDPASLNRNLNRRIKKLSPNLNIHKMRTLFVDYSLNKKNKFDNLHRANRVTKLLNHDGRNSGSFYDETIRIIPKLDLNALTVKKLRAMAREQGKKNYSRATKPALIKMLE